MRGGLQQGVHQFPHVGQEIIEVGTIIVATGLVPYDPTEMDEYGYTRFDNVMTSLEFERMVNASSPHQRGSLVRPSDREHPKSVG